MCMAPGSRKDTQVYTYKYGPAAAVTKGMWLVSWNVTMGILHSLTVLTNNQFWNIYNSQKRIQSIYFQITQAIKLTRVKRSCVHDDRQRDGHF